jgi:hypothetical protein
MNAAESPNMKKRDILIRLSGMHIMRGNESPENTMETTPSTNVA